VTEHVARFVKVAVNVKDGDPESEQISEDAVKVTETLAGRGRSSTTVKAGLCEPSTGRSGEAEPSGADVSLGSNISSLVHETCSNSLFSSSEDLVCGLCRNALPHKQYATNEGTMWPTSESMLQ